MERGKEEKKTGEEIRPKGGDTGGRGAGEANGRPGAKKQQIGVEEEESGSAMRAPRAGGQGGERPEKKWGRKWTT